MKIDHVLKLSLIPLCCLALWGCDVVKLDQHGKPIIPMSAAEAASLKNMTPAALADKFWDHILSEAQKVSGAFGEQTMKEDSSRFVRIHGIVNSLDDSKNAGHDDGDQCSASGGITNRSDYPGELHP